MQLISPLLLRATRRAGPAESISKERQQNTSTFAGTYGAVLEAELGDTASPGEQIFCPGLPSAPHGQLHAPRTLNHPAQLQLSLHLPAPPLLRGSHVHAFAPASLLMWNAALALLR